MKIFAKSLYSQISDTLKPVYDEREIRSIATILLEHFAKASKTDLLLNKELDWSGQQAENLNASLQRLKNAEPIQYILEEAPFFDFIFKVSPAVLIPRPETEELVQQILQNTRAKNVSILDIGTGSGCIPVSLKKNLPDADIHALDISDKALEIARFNANELGAQITFHQADILQQPELNQKFDIIVSNPPYVTEKEKTLMQSNVLDFEPHLALFVPDTAALMFYIAIADFALKNLKEKGKLYFEINEHYGSETLHMLEAKGFSNIILLKDLNGKDRMITASRSFTE